MPLTDKRVKAPQELEAVCTRKERGKRTPLPTKEEAVVAAALAKTGR